MLFGGEGVSFMATIAVSVLLSGMLLYYFNLRLRALERTAQKQNQVISGFLGGIQGDLVHRELQMASGPEGATQADPSALRAVRDGGQCSPQGGFCHRPGLTPLDKVAVSDDDVASSESGSEYTDVSESESDAEEAEGHVIETSAKDAVVEGSVKVIDLDGECSDDGETGGALVADTIEILKDSVEQQVGEGSEASEASEAGEQAEKDAGGAGTDTSGASADAAGEGTEGEASPAAGDEGGTVIDRLKVGKLRDMAISQGLATTSEARGMKKAQLLQILEPSAEAASQE